jgi:hypothetical protein
MAMNIEDQIAAIIKEIYDTTGFEDEGRSDQAAHEIMALLEKLMPKGSTRWR